MKIAESERPPSAELKAKHFGHLSKELTRFLVLDIQNDCDCLIEIYEFWPGRPTIILHPDRVETIKASLRLPIPIHTGRKIEDRDLSRLYREACLLCNDAGLWEKDPDCFYTGKIYETDEYDFMVPEPEFFGVLTCNLAGWGAFCFPSQLLRKGK